MKNIKNKFIPLLISFFAAVTLGLSGCMDLFDKEDVPTSFTVTFNGNGGKTASGEESFSEVVDYGVELTLPDANSFTKTGYKFKYWTPDKDSQSAIHYSVGSKQKFTANTTLYPEWEESGWTVTYDDGVEDEVIAVPEDTNVYEDGTTVTVSSEKPERTGYTFNGWTGAGKLLQAGDTFTITKHVSLSADWKENYIPGGNDGLKMTVTTETDPGFDISAAASADGTKVIITCAELSDYTYSWYMDNNDPVTLSYTTPEEGKRQYEWTVADVEKGSVNITLYVYNSTTQKSYSATVYVTIKS